MFHTLVVALFGFLLLHLATSYNRLFHLQFRQHLSSQKDSGMRVPNLNLANTCSVAI
jgi:hypothetical protein